MNIRHLMVAARTLSGHVDRRTLDRDDEHEIQALILKLEDERTELVHPDDLLGGKEAAAFLGVEKSTVTRWKNEKYLPSPYAEPASGPIWLRPALETFKVEHEAHADAAGRRPVGSRTPAPST